MRLLVSTLLASTLFTSCTPEGAGEGEGEGEGCELIHVDVVIEESFRIYPRPLAEAGACGCTENFPTNGACVLESSDGGSCACADPENGVVPSLQEARIERDGAVVIFDLSNNALARGMTSAPIDDLDPRIFDDVVLVLVGCWGTERVSIPGGAGPSIPSFAFAPGTSQIEATVDESTTLIRECFETGGGVDTTCCEHPAPAAPVAQESVVWATRDEGAVDGPAGHIQLWRLAGARAPSSP